MIRTEERGEGSACNFALSVTGLDRQQAAKDMTYETTVPMLAWPITSDSPAHKLQPRRARAKLHARECIGRLWQRRNTPGSAYVRTHAVQPNSVLRAHKEMPGLRVFELIRCGIGPIGAVVRKAKSRQLAAKRPAVMRDTEGRKVLV